MTTEEDFRRAINKHRDDWQTRSVFADWLEEQGDPRADGYRALGTQRRVPVRPNTPSQFIHPGYCTKRASKDVFGEAALEEAGHAVLPWDWFPALKKELGETDPLGDRRWACGKTVRGIEDAAARAFARLPAARRAELLTSPI